MTTSKQQDDHALLSGFGNEFSTQALPGALPEGQNSPQRCPYGLYAEQLSGTAFTAPRHENRRTWMYRIRPSVKHVGRMSRIQIPDWRSAPCLDQLDLPLAQYRWDPLALPSQPVNFVQGVRTMTLAGDVTCQMGMGAHVYLATASMGDEYFYSADSELLIIVEQGALDIATECGRLLVESGEIVVIPRGMMFNVALLNGAPSRGFICENYGNCFTLPELGPIGSNGLANARDFKTPVAAFQDTDSPCRVTVKWCGRFYQSTINHCPLDVVAWHGNHVPYKYDLANYSPVGSILFDHPDPSIFTVLTSSSDKAGTANVDFVVFKERWLVMENTFRPPWYHKNVMSEFMGNLYGVYDAKEHGFVPGGMSLHNCMLPHGPDSEAFDKASEAKLKPQKMTDTLSFMFETRLPQQLTEFAATRAPLQSDYADCWSSIERKFDGTPQSR